MTSKSATFGKKKIKTRRQETDAFELGRSSLEILVELADLAVHAPSQSALFANLAPRLRELIGCNLVCFALHDPAQNRMLATFWKEDQETGEYAHPVDECVSGWVWKHQQAVSIPDLENDSRFPSSMSALRRHGVRSCSALPLSTAARRYGTLGIGFGEPRGAELQPPQLLSQVSHMVALAVENQETHRAWQQEHERWKSLMAISQEMGSSLELEDLIPRILAGLRLFTGCEHAVFMLLGEDGKTIRTRAMSSSCFEAADGRLPVAVPLEESLSGRAVETRRITVWNDEDLASLETPVAKALRAGGMRSVCCLPLFSAERAWGALTLASQQHGAFREQDLDYLQPMANQLVAALDKAHANQQVQELRDRWQSLGEIGWELNSTLDLDRSLPLIFAGMRRILHHDYAVLALLEADHRTLRMSAADSMLGFDSLVTTGRAVPLSGSICAGAIQTRTITCFDAEDLEGIDTGIAKELRGAGIQCLHCVPLLVGNQALGALICGHQGPEAFRPEDEDYLLQVGSHLAAALQSARAHREIHDLKDRLSDEKHDRESEIRTEFKSDDLVGMSAALKHVLDYAAIVADTDSTVLITGETGTGKERVARGIHSMSRRRDRPFIKLNCAAIPTGLLESELFGHEKGAFTGAVGQKVGRLELADQGTLFLDEIGEIPLELQPKLLRVLQDQEFERLGGTHTIRVDVRLITATNRDLPKAVADKHFRSDLFYRLHVFPLHLPPLRERREDIPLLVRHFVERSCARLDKRIDLIPDEAIAAMLNWPWPGNIRELENFIERSVILSEGRELHAPLSELRQLLYEPSQAEGTLQEKERRHIIEVLRQTRGSLSGPSGAAARLGLKRTTLQYKMQKLGITRMDYLD